MSKYVATVHWTKEWIQWHLSFFRQRDIFEELEEYRAPSLQT